MKVESQHFVFEVSFPSSSMPPGDVVVNSPAGECIVGEALSFAPKVPAGECRIEIVDAPEGSAATPKGPVLVPDVPGVFTLRIWNGDASTLHRRVAFPIEALAHPIVADARFGRHEAHVPPTLRQPDARRLVLRKIAAMASRSLGSDPDAIRVGFHRELIGGARFADETFAQLDSLQPLPVGFDVFSL